MKKLFYFSAIIFAMFFVACSEEYDDSILTNRVDNLENRVSKLEQLCSQLNTNIASLQTIVTALQQNDYITNVAPITQNGKEVGYTIIFTSGKSITIYHGIDGQDGQDGADGVDGEDGDDGYTPVVGVQKASDGIYYWTIDGNWLLDADGNKIKAVGTDGKDGVDGEDGKDGADGATGPQGPQGPQGPAGADGEDGKDGVDGEDGKDGADGAPGPQGPQGPQGPAGADGKDGVDGKDGKDGITPQLKIENDYWYVSYDNGQTWVELGKATSEGASGSTGAQGPQGEQGPAGPQGPQGEKGEKGDSFFQSVTQDADNVYFKLADGTTITIPKASTLNITFNTNEYILVNEGESYEVSYTLTGADAETKVAAMAQDNYSVSVIPTTYQSGKIVVSAPSADLKDSQVLVFVSKGSQTIMRALYFLGSVLNVSTNNVQLGYDAESFNVKVTTNLDYTVHIPADASSWLSVASTRAMREETLSFTAAKNQSSLRRSTIVELRNNGKTIQSIAVNQDLNPDYLPASNKIYYTTNDGKIININLNFDFGVCVISNTYKNGKGVVIFDRDITTIPGSAFDGCSSLTTITIPDSVTEIGNSAFYDCSSLTSITIPDSVTEIGAVAFCGCSSLTSVTIPNSVTTIGGSAFSRCSSLTSVTIGDSVTTIGNYAFSGCSSLTSITIPDSVTTIGGGICNKVKEFKGKFAADGGRCLIKDNAIIAYAEASGTTYTIPDSVTTIGYSAFNGCSSLTSITIPDSVTTIGEDAFQYCSSLTSVIIGDSVTKIGSYAFYSCSSLTSVTIPDSVTKIADRAFSGCSSLTSITIPDSVTKIGENAFSKCSSLTSVTIGDSVTEIGEYAFRSCQILSKVNVGKNVSKIYQNAFSECSGGYVTIYMKPITPPAIYYQNVHSVCGIFHLSKVQIYVPRDAYDGYTQYTGCISRSCAPQNWYEYKSYIHPYDFE